MRISGIRTIALITFSMTLLTACDPPWDPRLTKATQPVPTPFFNVRTHEHGCGADIIGAEINPLAMVTIFWGDGTSSTGLLPGLTHTYAKNGNYTVKLKGEDNLSGWSSETAAIIADCNPQGGNSPVAIWSLTVNGCSAQIDSNLSSGSLIDWGDGSQETGLSASNHFYAQSGTYTVIAKDDRGEDSRTITVDCPAVAQPPAPTYYCANTYWPIVEGATWTFNVHEDPPKDYTETWTVTRISSDPQNPWFMLQMGIMGEFTFTCGPDGIFSIPPTDSTEPLKNMYLFPESQLVVGQTWSDPTTYTTVSVVGSTELTVPAGTFLTVRIQTNWTDYIKNIEFAPGVGPVHIIEQSTFYRAPHIWERWLVSFNIP